MDENKLERLLLTLQQQGYQVKQSPSNPCCWYLAKQQFHLLFALIFNGAAGWIIRDITGSGALELARLEREVAALWR